MNGLATFQDLVVPLVNAEWFKNTIPVLAFIVSISSLVFTQKALWASTRTSDLSALLTFVENLESRENDLRLSTNEEDRKVRFVELLNVLETYCAAYNFSLLPKVTRLFVRDKLVDALGLIASMPEWHARLQTERVGATAFAELGKFDARYRHRIDNAARMFTESDPEGKPP